MYKEPAWTIGAISTAVAGVLALLIAFGVPLTDAQQAAILGVIAGVAPLITALVIRGKVYSPSTRDADVAQAAGTSSDEGGAS